MVGGGVRNRGLRILFGIFRSYLFQILGESLYGRGCPTRVLPGSYRFPTGCRGPTGVLRCGTRFLPDSYWIPAGFRPDSYQVLPGLARVLPGSLVLPRSYRAATGVLPELYLGPTQVLPESYRRPAGVLPGVLPVSFRGPTRFLPDSYPIPIGSLPGSGPTGILPASYGRPTRVRLGS